MKAFAAKMNTAKTAGMTMPAFRAVSKSACDNTALLIMTDTASAVSVFLSILVVRLVVLVKNLCLRLPSLLIRKPQPIFG